MRLKTNREHILPAVSLIGGVVERRQTLPILSNMLVQVADSMMTLTATDLEVEVKTVASVDSDGEGEFTLPARKFIDICKALPEDSEINLEIQGDKASVRANRSRFSLGILPAENYPVIEASPAEFSFELKQGELRDLIAKTGFAMAQQDVRYYLNGMLLEMDSNKLRSVATDGHRLALGEIQVQTRLQEAAQVLLPRKAVLELARLLNSEDEQVSAEFSESFARFRLGRTTFTTKLIDGRFPDYDRVIPKDTDRTAVIDRELLRNALNRASILSSEKYKGVRLSFSPHTLKLQAHNPEQEEAEDEIEIEFLGGELNIGFNVGYLLDVLNTLETSTIELELGDSNSSAVIKVPGESRYLYVVMPMRL